MTAPAWFAKTDRFGEIRPVTPASLLAPDMIADGLLVFDHGLVRLALLVRNRRAATTVCACGHKRTAMGGVPRGSRSQGGFRDTESRYINRVISHIVAIRRD